MFLEVDLIEQISGLQSLACLIALFTFLNARSLVRSVPIFYTTGVLAGVLASFLLLGFFLQRLIPSSTRLPFFFGGWPVSIYIYYLTWRNAGTILREYQFYAVAYLIFFALLSLAVCYRMGPPKDERSLNLAEWTLQLIALTIVYFIVEDKKIANTLIVSFVLFAIWRRHSARIRTFYVKIFKRISEFLYGPQPRRLLSEQEYLDESRVNTRMELEKLRKFCCSQDSKKNWQLMSRLHTPNKMASFITGDNDHVSALEASQYSEIYGCPDEEEEEDDDELSSDEEVGGYITDDE